MPLDYFHKYFVYESYSHICMNLQAIRDARGEMYGAAGRLLFLRLATVGQRLGQAKTEIGQALNGLQNIGNVSAATAGGCVVLGLEMYLLFHVGEAIGRFNLIGYPVGPEYPDKHH